MDTIVRFSFWSALILSPMMFVGAMWRLRELRLTRRLLVSVLFSAALFASLLILAWSIFFRDGMGPDSIETHGADAFARCWTGIVFAFIVGAVLAAFGTVLVRIGKRQKHDA